MADHCGDVVLVDDDSGFRTFLSAVLEGAGYATVAVATAEDALVAVSKRRPSMMTLAVAQFAGRRAATSFAAGAQDRSWRAYSHHPRVRRSHRSVRSSCWDAPRGPRLHDHAICPGELVARVWLLGAARKAIIARRTTGVMASSTSFRARATGARFAGRRLRPGRDRAGPVHQPEDGRDPHPTHPHEARDPAHPGGRVRASQRPELTRPIFHAPRLSVLGGALAPGSNEGAGLSPAAKIAPSPPGEARDPRARDPQASRYWAQPGPRSPRSSS